METGVQIFCGSCDIVGRENCDCPCHEPVRGKGFDYAPLIVIGVILLLLGLIFSGLLDYLAGLSRLN